MCFGVRDALRATHHIAKSKPVTVLGQLVHNPEVDRHLKALGAMNGDLADTDSSKTADVVITAHGASDRQRNDWRAAGFQITDTTCPLVRKAHDALALLVADNFFPVVIGQSSHVEVRGLTGDFPQAMVVLSEDDIDAIPFHPKIGVISQTTQPLEVVLRLVEHLKRTHPQAEVRFIDTVCHPTKQRQDALSELCRENELILVIGGRNSNNTQQLVERARRLGRDAIQIESAADLKPGWFRGIGNVGVTAGTSTLDETVTAVVAALRCIAADLKSSPAHEFLRMAARLA
jgi:4-hydroxy-3-methylbut-2-en-1-yl diphosphate reductase